MDTVSMALRPCSTEVTDLAKILSGYSSYYNMNQDSDAICYPTLITNWYMMLNQMPLQLPEKVSGMRDLLQKLKIWGIGFDAIAWPWEFLILDDKINQRKIKTE